MTAVPLDQEFPDVPAGNPTPGGGRNSSSASSTLPNGLRVASCTSSDPMVTLSVQVDSGSQYETDRTAGLTQLLSNLSFRSTTSRSDIRLYRDIEAMGGAISSHYGRDFLQLNISVLPTFASAAAEMLAETTLSPRFAQWDVDAIKDKCFQDLEQKVQDPTYLLNEGLFAAAFYDSEPLGRHTSDMHNLKHLTAQMVQEAHATQFTAERMVFTATGGELSHAEVSGLASAFDSLNSGTTTAVPSMHTAYVGGEHRVKLQQVPFTNVSIGFEGIKWSDPLLTASFVLSTLLAHQVKDIPTASASNEIFRETGMFSLSGAATPEQSGSLMTRFITQLKNLPQVSAEEVELAKKLCKTQYAHQNEARLYRSATLGKMAQFNQVRSLSEVLSAIDNVTVADVTQVAGQIVRSGAPSISSVGDVSAIPRYNAICAQFQ